MSLIQLKPQNFLYDINPMPKLTYSQCVKNSLSRYKQEVLGITEDGIHLKTGRHYSHILPESSKELNILEPYRNKFWDYFKTKNHKLHRDFHHLNSSQALCFNLFFPLIYENQLSILLDILPIKYDLTSHKIQHVEFEKVMDKKEFTNFDFYMELESGKIFFEIKYTEGEFGSAKNDTEHLKKYENVYKPLFKDKINPKFQLPEQFFKNYQIIRNILYLTENDFLIFLYPRGNRQLNQYINLISNDIPTDRYINNIKIVYLEDLVIQILKKLGSKENKLMNHYKMFEAKYINTNEVK